MKPAWDGVTSPMVNKARKVRESTVEDYLVKRVEAVGGTAEKFKSPQKVNVPDRIVCFPAHRVYWREYPTAAVFVECKAPGKKPNAGQQRDHERRRAMGFRVYVVDTFEAVDRFIEEEGFYQ